ncbi:recombinase family protein [uncultured Treponema sp.]|uniref:recombinase family protein n=1 Tax=uncultured Treponema sp. TaxID=162155 RepID=UPI0025D60E78|nr:recombinase family protein [uncultured Treponema sp.]
MAVYGYLRVSTDKQDYNSQKQGVDNFAEKQGWQIDRYITDDGVSGSKDPYKRNLGSLLELLHKDDILIAAEISRLGRDLLMVMDILNHCMKVGAVVYTVKDNYKLGDDIQSKVLAFAFGLSAEIERKMLQARTKEGLMLRVKKGVLLGRPKGRKNSDDATVGNDKKDEIIMQYKLGVPLRRMEQNLGINRNTISHRLIDWGLITDPKLIKTYENWKKKVSASGEKAYWKEKEGLDVVIFSDDEKEKVRTCIEADFTIPEIHAKLKKYTYEQVYDTIYNDFEFNSLYRQHAQKLLVRSHNAVKNKR